jgi:tRNA(fMet)-specific endonuclease VapC
MILLDRDHVTVLRYAEDSRHEQLLSRINATPTETFGTTIISAEEQMRGWLSLLNSIKQVQRQVVVYERFAALFKFYAAWLVLEFDTTSAERFEALRRHRIRIGTQDLKIASIALLRDALLLSANLRDFRQVPGLRIENWLS